jgi:4-aminobutyrate aminotransferase/(S)-3-amino-2-methylpropionate transaminase
VGKIFVERARQWQRRFECIGDVRGLGGMQAIELVLDRDEKTPAPELTKKLARYACEHGLIVVTAGTFGNVLRLLVPLVVTDAQMHEGLDVIEAALAAFAGKETQKWVTSAS